MWPPQRDSPLTELPSPRGEEERDRPPLSVFSELEPFWLWWSATAAAEDAAEEAEEALDDVAEVDEGRAFSLKSVMITVRSPTVTSRCWALLRSMFFNRGLAQMTGGVLRSGRGLENNHIFKMTSTSSFCGCSS